MLTLIIGAAGSGKSAFAENFIQSFPGQKLYIATMLPQGEEAELRISRHRLRRSGRGFQTVECGLCLEELTIQPQSNVLLEDLSNLLANELFEPQGRGSHAAAAGLQALQRQCGNLTVVSNEVFSGGSRYADDTDRFLRALAAWNREIAREADLVVEVVCGLPNVLKGVLPCS